MARLRTGSKALIRDLNRSAILALIGSRGPIARVDIARQLSLSAGTVTALTRELVETGLITELDKEPSSGGRPAIRLALVGRAARVIGVKIAPDHITVVLAHLDGEPVEFAERAFDASAPNLVEALAAELAPLIARWTSPPARLLGIGMGVPGIADERTGVVESPLVGWHSLPLGPQLEARLDVPVLIDNDVNTLAVAERLYGRGRAVDHFLTVTLGRGVGLGIVIGGELYRGARGGAGELGHMRVSADGPLCYCGKRGCLETFVSDGALAAAGHRAGILGPDEQSDRLRALADSGDPDARRVFATAGAFLGRAVAGLVNVLSPGLVIVSGEGIQAWPHLSDAFDRALRQDVFEPLRDVPVEMDPWDDAKWARGAAALVLQATFAAPLYERDNDDAIRARLVAASTPVMS